MPFPLLAIPAVAVAAAVGAGVVTVKNSARKKIAILGPSDAGKSTLVKFLQSGTVFVELLPWNTVRFARPGAKKDKQFRVDHDLPGDNGPLFKQWKIDFLKSDYVLYLFPADLILSGDMDATERMVADIENMSAWGKKKSKKAIILVGTHADRVENGALDDEALLNAVKKTAAVTIGILKLKADVVLGSLASDEKASQLTEHIDVYL